MFLAVETAGADDVRTAATSSSFGSTEGQQKDDQTDTDSCQCLPPPDGHFFCSRLIWTWALLQTGLVSVVNNDFKIECVIRTVNTGQKTTLWWHID
ncbi:unnamed protein product [Soboliphyme baturini]|uniref:Secreted protein n=1 Tax=Soboliphyme baturini TaxID=241478 RepID=A0A183IJN8_9BILA|nr:unnamed protein product [Soboliphyme baturini]